MFSSIAVVLVGFTMIVAIGASQLGAARRRVIRGVEALGGREVRVRPRKPRLSERLLSERNTTFWTADYIDPGGSRRAADVTVTFLRCVVRARLCPRCGYDLSAGPDLACPGCGASAAASEKA